MLSAGLIVNLATNQSEASQASGNKKFDYGTLMIPVAIQKENSETVAVMISALVEKYRLKAYAASTGLVASGSDFGSGRFVSITKPSVAMLVGPGVNATDAG